MHRKKEQEKPKCHKALITNVEEMRELDKNESRKLLKIIFDKEIVGKNMHLEGGEEKQNWEEQEGTL